MQTLPLWINNKPVESKTTRYGDVTNPATGEVIRRVPLGSTADVNAAVAAALAALPAWSTWPALRRARVLMRFRELLGHKRESLRALITE